MPQKFTRDLTREIEVAGQRLAVTFSEKGLSIRPVGSRKPPREVTWADLMSLLAAQPPAGTAPAPPAPAAEQATAAAPAGPGEPGAPPRPARGGRVGAARPAGALAEAAPAALPQGAATRRQRRGPRSPGAGRPGGSPHPPRLAQRPGRRRRRLL